MILPKNLSDIISLLSQVAGHILRERASLSCNSIRKSDGSLVCQADIESERLIIDALSSLTPGIPIFSEESLDKPELIGSEQLLWVLDPLDGTEAYLKGLDTFGLMLALVRQGYPVGAWIVCPALAWKVWGWHGCNTLFSDGIEISRSSRPVQLSHIRAVLASGDFESEHIAKVRWHKPKLAQLSGTVSCAVDYLEFLSGHHDFLLYRRSHVWDHAAGVCLSGMAGAIVTRFDGSPVRFGDQKEGIVVACTNRVRILCEEFLP